jgi:carbon-monoxide dehydrogenase medium subunit
VKPPPFAYHRPESLEEALELLAQDEDAKVLAGGQSLIPVLNFRMARPSALVDLARVGLKGIRRENGTLVIGAMTRQWDLEQHAETPALLREALAHVGHIATRCRGTVGGSLVHADPTAELPVCALALGAEMTIASREGTRVVPAVEFFQFVFTTAVGSGEMLVETRWPLPVGPTAFVEYAHRHGDFAVVCVALAGDRIALGGVAPTPLLFEGRSADEIADSLDPLGTDDAPAEYKRELARGLVRRALEQAA